VQLTIRISMEVWGELQHHTTKKYEFEHNVNMDPPQHLSNQFRERTIKWIHTSPTFLP